MSRIRIAGTVLLIAALAYLFAASNRFARVTGAGASWAKKFLEAPVLFVAGMTQYADLSREAAALRLENAELRAKIFEISKRSTVLEHDKRRWLAAKAYSDYPANNRSLVTVAAGRRDGVRVGMTVAVGGEGLFFGEVVETGEEYSIVRTILDSGWELPVRVGNTGVNALLVGGREPKLTLVTKEKPLEEGATIYTARRNDPYGLTIGTAKGTRIDQSAAFQEAGVNLPYAFSDIDEVLILLP